MTKARECIFCHCTDDDACTLSGGANCSWLSDKLPACTAPACAFAAGVLDGFLRSGYRRGISLSWAQIVYEQACIRLGAPKL